MGYAAEAVEKSLVFSKSMNTNAVRLRWGHALPTVHLAVIGVIQLLNVSVETFRKVGLTVRFALVKKSRRWPALLALMSLLATPSAFADGVAELKRFVSETQSLKADFQQEVSGRDQKSEQARGTLQLSRPGKFRWIYQKPLSNGLLAMVSGCGCMTVSWRR